MHFSRISILGVGLLGGSIGLACRRGANKCTIIGYGHRPETLQRAKQRGAIDEGASDPAAAVREADLVILATPVGIFPDLLMRIAPALQRGAIVTDVGSTKRSIVQLAEKLLPPGVRFVGSHPMAGSEKRGVEVARADLFDNALCITTPTPNTDPAALERVEQFWQALGSKTTRLSPDDHDRLLAQVSHLPHALAAALVSLQPDQALALAGKGFMDVTRIAAGDPAMWRDIFQDNRDHLAAAIDQLRHRLDELTRLLDPARSEDLRNWLTTAAEKRQALSATSRD